MGDESAPALTGEQAMPVDDAAVNNQNRSSGQTAAEKSPNSSDSKSETLKKLGSAANSTDSKSAKLAQEKLDIAVGMSLQVAALTRPTMSELKDVRFSLSVADPQLPDCPLLMVSQGFYELTGYSNEDVIGKNCRFLNEGCSVDPRSMAGLRAASKTGCRFCVVIPNRKKDGTPFKNLLEVRGLRVGRLASGEEKLLMIGMQADVSDVCEDVHVPKHHAKNVASLTKVISKQVTQSLLRTVSGALDGVVELYDKPAWVKEDVVVPCDVPAAPASE